MKPYLADSDFTLYNGDALEVLRTLPDESVHMCVTSPPFYGLRDYGTGTWEGGDAECDHEAEAQATHERSARQRRSMLTASGSRTRRHGDRRRTATTCGKCGATRIDRQIGLEETPEQWVQKLVEVFREVRRVLRRDGTLWLEVGDSYATQGNTEAGRWRRLDPRRQRKGYDTGRRADTRSVGSRQRSADVKPKDLIGAPWLLAFALRADGWYLRSDIVWSEAEPHARVGDGQADQEP